MKKFRLSKENIALIPIIVLSAILCFYNLSIEGTSNAYYAAAVKSMSMSWKNFFFVAYDPAGFVTIDKPPVGFWLQALSAKISGYSGVSILLPQALAGVISVILIYKIVKRSFGHMAGLLSALFLAITPVFVAVSRNNTIDNTLVLFLLLACWALSAAAEKGKFKYLILSMVLVGIGFNVKMLQAYMVAPALYITYLLSTAVSIKKRIVHLVVATFVLFAVSMSWALIVDSIPASSRPYVDSSTNNTVSELILGHNGAERLSLSSNSNNPGGGSGNGMGHDGNSNGMPGNPPSGSFNGNGPGGNIQNNSNTQSSTNTTNNSNTQSNTNTANSSSNSSNQNMPTPPNGDFQNMRGQMGAGGNGGGNSSMLQGSFGGQTASSILRLFSKNMLSDQIVWFIPIAIFGFIAASIKEKLTFKLDNKKKQALVLWFMWFLPEFIYFSFNTGTFHSYYLTMLAPPIAALAGIGVCTMWYLYKEGGWKSWFMPAALIANGAMDMLMLYYFISYSSIIKVLMILVAVLCFVSSIVLCIMNVIKSEKPNALKFRKALLSLSLAGVMISPLVGSAAVLTHSVGSLPAAGLELLSSSQGGNDRMSMGMGGAQGGTSSQNSTLVNFLLKNKTTEKYLLVVSNSNSASEIIIQTGQPVMSLGGFLGSDNIVTLAQFKQMVKNGEIRYVMTGGQGGSQGSGSSITEIMNWVKSTGKLVSASEYGGTASSDTQTAADNTADTSSNQQASASSAQTNSDNQQSFGHDGNGSRALYDLKSYTESSSK